MTLKEQKSHRWWHWWNTDRNKEQKGTRASGTPYGL